MIRDSLRGKILITRAIHVRTNQQGESAAISPFFPGKTDAKIRSTLRKFKFFFYSTRSFWIYAWTFRSENSLVSPNSRYYSYILFSTNSLISKYVTKTNVGNLNYMKTIQKRALFIAVHSINFYLDYRRRIIFPIWIIPALRISAFPWS